MIWRASVVISLDEEKNNSHDAKLQTVQNGREQVCKHTIQNMESCEMVRELC